MRDADVRKSIGQIFDLESRIPHLESVSTNRSFWFDKSRLHLFNAPSFRRRMFTKVIALN